MGPRRRVELRHPLSLSVVHILLALADGARHGYAIKQAVEERSEGEIRLGPGTLYEAIQRLEDAGYIEETGAADAPENGQAAQRRYYR
jgi:DNA-binding PadR family transcriptional regulator